MPRARILSPRFMTLTKFSQSSPAFVQFASAERALILTLEYNEFYAHQSGVLLTKNTYNIACPEVTI
jgi:hypothetical protein